jgi:hypothetical protein
VLLFVSVDNLGAYFFLMVILYSFSAISTIISNMMAFLSARSAKYSALAFFQVILL